MIKIGDVFYRLMPTTSVAFRSECRVCGGERKLTVNEITFPCPMCHKETEVLSVHGYEVRRFKVFSIEEKANNDYWKLGNIRKIYSFFTKRGLGMCNHYNSSEWRINEEEFATKLNKTDIFTPKNANHLVQSVYFDDYALAVETAERLTEWEREKVTEFNKEHGTDFDLPVFEIDHDKK